MNDASSMHAVIRHYHFAPKDSKVIDQKIADEFLPIIRKAKGFVRYYWLDKGNGEGTSVSIFREKQGADDSVALAASYVHDHLADLMKQKPEIIEGPVVVHD